MQIGVNYPSPVTVNGFSCRNCSEVDIAKRHIDPQHPRSGPDNADALSDPTRSQADKSKIAAQRAASGPKAEAYSAAGAKVAGSAPIGGLVNLVA
ncbi:hypothetical protein SAMN05444678_1011 [Sphingomonas sp. YR710]|jgi:hypothetical protein|uniref:hypothetical protein n=1 Tax=Sphingomonas sp. YR710 TaxID=1882773 RepID=UPI00087ECF1B|nr:hypothetical protein [Sphingomonas sp. YR710]SDB97886.1 hypothetical protein SAMN05444678_1011 [Sphingomonas sp. YR710]